MDLKKRAEHHFGKHKLTMRVGEAVEVLQDVVNSLGAKKCVLWSRGSLAAYKVITQGHVVRPFEKVTSIVMTVILSPSPSVCVEVPILLTQNCSKEGLEFAVDGQLHG